MCKESTGPVGERKRDQDPRARGPAAQRVHGPSRPVRGTGMGIGTGWEQNLETSTPANGSIRTEHSRVCGRVGWRAEGSGEWMKDSSRRDGGWRMEEAGRTGWVRMGWDGVGEVGDGTAHSEGQAQHASSRSGSVERSERWPRWPN